MDKLWMRIGDSGDYEDFDNPEDAGDRMSSFFDSEAKVPKVSRSGRYGVAIAPLFTGYNYVSLYWGDDDADPTREVTNADIAAFRRGIAEGADIPVRRAVSPKRKPKTSSAKRRRASVTGRSISTLR